MDIKKINERLEESENTPLSNEKWYVTNKFGDWLLDTIPYGWRMYYKTSDIKRWFVSAYQRIRYGVTDEECWSLDYTFSKFILPRLKHFKKINRNSYHPDMTPEQWEAVIDELIWTFEYMLDEDRFNPFPHSLIKGTDFISVNNEKTEEEKQLFSDWRKKNDELEERSKKGRELFAKYYRHLWD